MAGLAALAAVTMFIFGLTVVRGRNPEPLMSEQGVRGPLHDIGSGASRQRS
jgi:hypothetical protein